LSFFQGGDGQHWADHYYDTNRVAINAGTLRWDKFIEDADEYFKDPRQSEHHRQNIFLLRMRKGETARNFFIRFEEMKRRADIKTSNISNDMLVEHLMRILPVKLTEAISIQFEAMKASTKQNIDIDEKTKAYSADKVAEAREILKNKTLDYQTLRDLAETHDPNVRRFETEYFDIGPSRSKAAIPWYMDKQFNNHNPFKDDVPMEIDRVQMNNWRRDAMKKGLCFNCGKPGHTKKDCREPIKKRSTPNKKFPRNRNRNRALEDAPEEARAAIYDMSFEDLKAFVAEREAEIQQYTDKSDFQEAPSG
jgi:hypothetical protein